MPNVTIPAAFSFVLALVAGQALAAPAARFKTVFPIPGLNDGAFPVSALIKFGGAYFGTTSSGGARNAGTVFRIDAGSGQETTLHSFSGGGDGSVPLASLIAHGGNLFGTTSAGGAADAGTVFKIDPDAGAETVVYSFTGFPGDSGPEAPLVAFGDDLYGTTATGGAAEDGTIFKLNPATGAETSLYAFGTSGANDGNFPHAAMIVVGQALYGTTFQGGAADSGTIFRFDPATGSEVQLHALNGGTDGALVAAPLLEMNHVLFGTASQNGGSNDGTLFSLDPGTGTYAVLHAFSGGADGGFPLAGLLVRGGTLYGTTGGINTQGSGTVFAIDPVSHDLTTLHEFGSGYDGVSPAAALLEDGGLLYGVAQNGGFTNDGVAFSIDPVTQTEAIVHQFSGSDSSSLASGLIGVGGALYGSATRGGAFGFGIIVRVDAGTGAGTPIYSFKGGNDGLEPSGMLVDADGTLYGTTAHGGTNNLGTVFKLDAQGVRTTLHDFSGNADGAQPQGGLLALGGTLYGTTYEGGASNNGTIFAIDPASGAETILYAFTGGPDGALPWAPLIHVGDKLYGTTLNGGIKHNGVVFTFDTKARREATTYAFKGDADGAAPFAPLTNAHGLLYGTTSGFGQKITGGTVFSIDPKSGVETVLHSFGGKGQGNMPLGGVIETAGRLYGTTTFGGIGFGTVYALDPATGAETTLYSFTGGADAGFPEASLVKSGPFLWSTTAAAAGDAGTVFKIKP